MFDLVVWIISYVGVGILRNALRHIQERRNSLLESLIIDRRISPYLLSARRLAFILSVLSLAYIILGNLCFHHARFRINQVLLYPALLLFLDSTMLLFTSGLIRQRLCYYFNNNIDDISPVHMA